MSKDLVPPMLVDATRRFAAAAAWSVAARAPVQFGWFARLFVAGTGAASAARPQRATS